MPRIFEPFFTTKENARGLGLATCFLIARNHDGFMTVDSAPDYGTTFFLYLPALPASAGRTRAAGTARWRCAVPAATGGTGRTVRAGPIPPGRRTRGACWSWTTKRPSANSRPNCSAARVSSSTRPPTATEAIRAYTTARDAGRAFDVVILDLTVRGGMGGRETVLRLMQIDPDVRAIVSSGYSQDPMMSRYRDYGFCGVVSKPYSVSELRRRSSRRSATTVAADPAIFATRAL